MQDQVIVDGITVAGVVVAAVGYEQVQKVVGVHVIANPAPTRDLEVSLGDRVQIDLPLLVGNGDVDIQLGFPHLLYGNGNLPVRFLGVVNNLQPGPALAIGIACLSQQRPGPVGVIGEQLRRVVPQCVGWRNAVGRHRRVLQDTAHQLVPVHRHGQRLPHLNVINRGAVGVDQVVIGAQVGSLYVGGVCQFPVDGNLVQGYHLGVVQLLDPEHTLLAHHIFGGVEHHAVQADPVPVPVQIAFGHFDVAVQGPVGEYKGAVADDIADPGPGGETVGHFAELEQGLGVHRKGAVVIHQLNKVGGRGIQRNFQGGVIQGLHTYLGKILDLALRVGLGIDHREQHVGIQVAGLRMQRPIPAPDIVTGGDLFAVGPARFRIQIEGNDPALIAELPALGHPRLRLQGNRVLNSQTLKQGPDQVIFRNTGNHMGIEALGLGTIAVV